MTKTFPVLGTPFWICGGRFTSAKHGDLYSSVSQSYSWKVTEAHF